MMFNRVCIIGFGLIGSSLARAFRQKNLVRKIVCADSSANACKTVMDLNLADEATTDAAEGVRGCDLVIIAVPVGAFESVGKHIRDSLMPGAIVTDVGSVKQDIIEKLGPAIPPGIDFIPSHPIAGTEHSGPESGFAELFEGRWFLITPIPGNDPEKVKKLGALWESIGSKVDYLEPRHHDLTLAITSHLPHLIAYTIVGTASDLGEDLRSEVIRYSASGFRDFTRIASSDPVMWRDIFLGNRDAVLEILQRFTEDLTDLQKAIRRGDGEKLFDHFTKTRGIRRQVIEAGQASNPHPTISGGEET
jgi:cyclohexadieny/prephenate dehydrogenase